MAEAIKIKSPDGSEVVHSKGCADMERELGNGGVETGTIKGSTMQEADAKYGVQVWHKCVTLPYK